MHRPPAPLQRVANVGLKVPRIALKEGDGQKLPPRSLHPLIGGVIRSAKPSPSTSPAAIATGRLPTRVEGAGR